MTRRPLFLLLIPLALAVLAGCMDRELPTSLAAPEAASFVQVPSSPVVNSLADDGTGCSEAKCTLRDAIAFASPGARITFSVTGTIQLSSRTLYILQGLTIAGPGPEQLTIRGAGNRTLFEIWSDEAPVTISGLTLTGAGTGSENQGSAIWAWDGDITIENSVITRNFGYYAGGIIYWSGGPGLSWCGIPPSRTTPLVGMHWAEESPALQAVGRSSSTAPSMATAPRGFMAAAFTPTR